MTNFTTKEQYFYCPDTNKYVKCNRGIFYSINDGKEVLNRYYDKILIGDIYYEDITKEEYYAQIN